MFNVNFGGSQYPDCFRDLLRGNDINAGADVGSTGNTALNLTGSAVAGSTTWLTVYDTIPATLTADSTCGAQTLRADVLIQPFSNTKGAGVVALMNEGAGKKGLGLFISDAGNTDTLILSTVDGDPAQKGKLTTVQQVSLQGGITEKAWYRVVMTVNPTGTPTVTGKVFAHATATDPNSALGAQVGSTLTYGAALPAGVTSPGENGIMAFSSVSALVNSSVTNFAGGCGSSDAELVDNGDGTVTHTQTGLMWEKKVAGSGCLHCVDDTYAWSDGMSEFVSHVNGITDVPSIQPGLGGHSDWRLPTIAELQTILLLGPEPPAPFPCSTSPCIDPIFGPTAAGKYWSSTTLANNQARAWFVFFDTGGANDDLKTDSDHVRAVRRAVPPPFVPFECAPAAPVVRTIPGEHTTNPGPFSSGTNVHVTVPGTDTSHQVRNVFFDPTRALVPAGTSVLPGPGPFEIGLTPDASPNPVGKWTVFSCYEIGGFTDGVASVTYDVF